MLTSHDCTFVHRKLHAEANYDNFITYIIYSCIYIIDSSFKFKISLQIIIINKFHEINKTSRF